jgi:hypothetical protein
MTFRIYNIEEFYMDVMQNSMTGSINDKIYLNFIRKTNHKFTHNLVINNLIISDQFGLILLDLMFKKDPKFNFFWNKYALSLCNANVNIFLFYLKQIFNIHNDQFYSWIHTMSLYIFSRIIFCVSFVDNIYFIGRYLYFIVTSVALAIILVGIRFMLLLKRLIFYPLNFKQNLLLFVLVFFDLINHTGFHVFSMTTNIFLRETGLFLIFSGLDIEISLIHLTS